jgi:S-adenosylmethionine-diacylgycerolhomoserine-N-methlytransferase
MVVSMCIASMADGMTDQAGAHADLMDANYRYQRLIYDVTRRYYLLGRDHLISNLSPPKDARVLEVACGTGRNLAQVARQYPQCKLYGLDISNEMLQSARAKLGGRAQLAHADACAFDPQQLFGVAAFDRIILSYSLSMIPDWTAALETATRNLAPGGQLHVIDFGNQSGLPRWFRTALRGWLAKFHVTPRIDLAEALAVIAARAGAISDCTPRLRDYAQYAVLRKPIERPGHNQAPTEAAI